MLAELTGLISPPSENVDTRSVDTPKCDLGHDMVPNPFGDGLACLTPHAATFGPEVTPEFAQAALDHRHAMIEFKEAYGVPDRAMTLPTTPRLALKMLTDLRAQLDLAEHRQDHSGVALITRRIKAVEGVFNTAQCVDALTAKATG